MSYRLFELPPALCSGTAALQLFCQRDQPSTSYGQLWLGKNYALNGSAPESFSLLQTFSRFAWHGKLSKAYPAATLCIDTRLGLTLHLDGPDLILDEVTDFDAIGGKLWMVIDGELMFVVNPQLTGNGVYSLGAVRGQYGTPIQDHAAGADVFIIRSADFDAIELDNVIAGNIGEFKVTLGVQNVSDQVSSTINFAGTFITPAAITNLSLNGLTQNAIYNWFDPFAIAWLLPAIPGVDLTKSYTLIEFLVAGVVTQTVQEPWPTSVLSYPWPDAYFANLVIRASLVVTDGWTTIAGPTVTLNASEQTPH